MSLKPTFRPVLLVFFRLLKCYQNGGSFCRSYFIVQFTCEKFRMILISGKKVCELIKSSEIFTVQYKIFKWLQSSFL